MPTPAFLVRLMRYTSLSRGTRLGPEDASCVAFANELRVATIEGRMRAVWVHPAQELCFGHKTGVRAAVSRAMGMHVGVSDYLFMMRDGSLAIEFKSKSGSMTEGQKAFAQWCEAMGVPHHVVRSAEAGLQILRDAGVLS